MFPYSEDNQTVSSQNFHKFLLDYQKDFSFGEDQKAVQNFICDFIQDPQREIQEPYLSVFEVQSARISANMCLGKIYLKL